MRMIDLLNEEPKSKQKTAIKTKDKIDIRFVDPSSKGELTATKSNKTTSVELPGSKKSATQTHQTQFNTPQNATNIMRSFIDKVGDIDDEVSDDDIEFANFDMDNEENDGNVGFTDFGIDDEKTNNQQLVPISKDVTVIDNEIDINWHKIKHLPGYAIKQIRGAFRPLFKSLSDTPLEDIEVATTLDPSTSFKDMRKLISAIHHHGIKQDDFSLEAFNIDPQQYHISQAYVYDVGDKRFLILEERLMGNTNYYVYSISSFGTELPDAKNTRMIR